MKGSGISPRSQRLYFLLRTARGEVRWRPEGSSGETFGDSERSDDCHPRGPEIRDPVDERTEKRHLKLMQPDHAKPRQMRRHPKERTKLLPIKRKVRRKKQRMSTLSAAKGGIHASPITSRLVARCCISSLTPNFLRPPPRCSSAYVAKFFDLGFGLRRELRASAFWFATFVQAPQNFGLWCLIYDPPSEFSPLMCPSIAASLHIPSSSLSIHRGIGPRRCVNVTFRIVPFQ